MRVRKTLSHIPCADNMAALQDAWSVLKNEPVEKGIFDIFRRKKEEEGGYQDLPEPEGRLGTTDPDPFTPELSPEPEMSETTPTPQLSEGSPDYGCENCKALEKQLKREAGTNRALMNKLSSLEFQMQQLKKFPRKKR